jgi:DNA-binding LytR/AlgR family response regulator
MIINCIAVDDEPVALDIITNYIEKTPFLKLIAKCPSALNALQVIHEHPEVQLLFLDIRMADLSGMELARIVEQSANRKAIRIIFTTAYDQYALESYKVAALDYLLKPFNFADFTRAANRALDYYETLQQKSTETATPTADLSSANEYLYLKVEYQLVKVNVNDILYIEGLKDYAKVFLANEQKPLLTLTTLKKLEERLPPTKFLRIHRSFIISLDKVNAVTKSSVQIGKTTIQVSEPYRDVFQGFLNKWV